MAYCDFDFYTTKYHGNLISEGDFDRLADKASDKLDFMTFDRLVDGLPTDERTAVKVKKAVCALADMMSDFELVDKTSREGTGYIQGADGLLKGKSIASISAGSESISFSSGSTQLAPQELNERERMMDRAVREYLSGTGLLYAGV